MTERYVSKKPNDRPKEVVPCLDLKAEADTKVTVLKVES